MKDKSRLEPDKNPAPPPPPPSDLDADTLLAAEYQYLQQTAFQATEDRARVASYYLVTVGSLVAGILSAQIVNLQTTQVYLGFAGLFFLLAANGILTILQLARLRQAWYESVEAMNQLKDFYLQRFSDLRGAFRWHNGNLPPRFKAWSVSYMMALEVAALASGALAAAVVFASISLNFAALLPAVLSAVIYFATQMLVYRLLLKRAAK